jgi:hypothetical protein
MNISQATTVPTEDNLSLTNNCEQPYFVGDKSQTAPPAAPQNAAKAKPKQPRKPAAKRSKGQQQAKSQFQKVEQVVSNVEAEKIISPPMPIQVEVKPKPAILVTEDLPVRIY